MILVSLVAAQEIYAGRGRRTGTPSRDRGSLYVLWLLIGLGYAAAFYLWRQRGGPPGPRLGNGALWVGFAVLLAGMALRLWAVRTLGPWFTFVVKVSDDQPVVESGPYRLLRHPSYTGAILGGVGLGLSLRYALAPLIVAVPMTAGMLIRIRVEEQALLAGIGAPYRAYMTRTKRLVPYLW